MHVNTIPAMAPELNDEVEKVLLFCDKGDEVEEDGDTDEAREVEELEVGVEEGVRRVDIRDDEVCEELLIVLVIKKVVVVFSEMLVRLLDWEVVECEGFDVETSATILMTVTVFGVGSPVLFSSLISSNCQTAI